MRAHPPMTLIALLLASACAPVRPIVSAPPPPRRPPPASAPHPAPSAVLTAEPPADRYPPPPAPNFTEGPAIRFRTGGTLKLKPIAKQTRIIALSPDGRSWVLDDSHVARLFTPGNPAGVGVNVWVPSARFSADGARVLIWSTRGLALLDVATGRTLASRDGAICGAAFLGTDRIVFHQESDDPDARFWHWKIGEPKPAALGPAREARTCHVSLDGERWLVEGYRTLAFIDGRTGQARPLAEPGTHDVVSPAGNRTCTGAETGMVCVRYPDLSIERVWMVPTSSSMVFDSTGNHALITFVDGPDGVYDAYAFVDFDARTVRRMHGVRATSGSLFSLGPDGKILTIGSGQGLYVYDLDKALIRFAPHSPLYGNFTFPYNPRRLVAGTDEPMDLFIVEVP